MYFGSGGSICRTGEDPEEGEDEEAHGGLRRDGLDRMEQLGDAAGQWHGQDQGQGGLARAETRVLGLEEP